MASNKPLIVADPNKGVKMDAAIVAEPFREEIRTRVRELQEHGIRKYLSSACGLPLPLLGRSPSVSPND